MSKKLSKNSKIERNDQICMTFPDGKKFHMGYSRLSKFLQCPRQYYYSYVEKIEGVAGVPLRRGSAYHAALETMLRFKMEHDGALMGRERCDKLAIRCAKAENLTDAEIYRVIDAVRYYHMQLYTSHLPIAIEHDFDICRGGVRLTGRIDLLEVTGWVTDHKFSYDTWADARARYGCQPAIYHWAALDQFEKEFEKQHWTYRGFAYNIIRLYPHPVIQKIEIPPLTQDQSDWWEQNLNDAARIIRKGIFPAIASDANCTRCSFKDICKPVIYDIEKTNIGVDMDADLDEY